MGREAFPVSYLRPISLPPSHLRRPAVLRHMAINAMQKEGSKGSLRGKFKRAGWDDAYLLRLLELFWAIINLTHQEIYPILSSW